MSSGSRRYIDAAEAAGRLGVKTATLYAYVSRGVLARRKVARRSLFDADEVEALRASRRRSARGEVESVVTTALTRIEDGRLHYRGRSVGRIASFERAASILWERQPVFISPTRQTQLADAARGRPIDRVRLAVVSTSMDDAMRHDRRPESFATAAAALIAAMVDGLARKGRATAPLVPRLWRSLSSARGTALQHAALDTALRVLADHGLATSTFAVRVAASVRADLYSIVLAGLGALGGAMHGAASSQVHRLFQYAETHGAAEAVGQALESGRLPGTGHAVYRTRDPRNEWLCKALERGWRPSGRGATFRAVRRLVRRRAGVVNVDFALGAFTYLAHMSEHAGEAIFAIARTVGWTAHALEEFEAQPIRFRPRARYAGD